MAITNPYTREVFFDICTQIGKVNDVATFGTSGPNLVNVTTCDFLEFLGEVEDMAHNLGVDVKGESAQAEIRGNL